MARINFYVQVFLYVALCTQSVFGLKCYVCNSGQDPECAMSPPPEKYLQECKEGLEEMQRTAKLQDAGNSVPVPAPESEDEKDIVPVGEDPAFSTSPSSEFSKDESANMSRTARSAEEVADHMKMNANNETNSPAAAMHQPNSAASNEAPKEATFCRKISYHIPAQSNGPNSTMKASVRVLRSCGWIPEEKKGGDQPAQSGCKWIGSDGTQMDQCVCTGDGCNSGNYLGSLTSQTLFLLAVMTAGYFYVL